MSDTPKRPDDRLSEFPLLKDDFVAGVGEEEKPEPGPAAPKPAVPEKPSRFAEQPPPRIVVASRTLKLHTRRDFLIYGGAVAAAAAGFWWLLPEDTHANFLGGAPADPTPSKERFLNRTLSFDDDVAAALYSPDRLVPTYKLSQAAPTLRNNYDGDTPDPGYLDDWTLRLSGLESGKTEKLTVKDIERLIDRFGYHEQVTRLCCVEGWSMIAGWGGLRFADLIRAYPPLAGSNWAAMGSSVNLDSDGNSDPYYVSIDLPTAMHPQTLLATHQNGPNLNMIPLSVDNGAPVRLLAPMKLGLKNIKAVTSIKYTAIEPADYWNERGYSKYDGV
jgi:DMSO/TMAO reductase YedYZ molybdopterin-dependent catalytic subunit